MQPKDKMKTIIALSLVGILAIAVFFLGQDAQITKYISGICLLTWLVAMVLINRKYK